MIEQEIIFDEKQKRTKEKEMHTHKLRRERKKTVQEFKQGFYHPILFLKTEKIAILVDTHH